MVIALTAVGLTTAPALVRGVDPESARLVGALLGALFGYLIGGGAGRAALHGVDEVQERATRVDAPVLIAAGLGATVTTVVAGVLVTPLLFVPNRGIAIPLALVVVLLASYAGAKIGATRGGDLSRFVGVRGRVEVSSPARGGGVKVVDTSALADGRMPQVARAGFLEGTLVVPEFVLSELHGLADSEDRRKRDAGRRGLDSVRALQDEGAVVVEVSQDDVPRVAEVDGKLAVLASQRGASLLTTDSGLARVAEVAGTRVLNLHELAEAVRPPARPGDTLRIQLVKEGTEAGQGVGYLTDGSMVVVEHAGDSVGEWLAVEVTSITQTSRGRMLFAVPAPG